LHWYLNLDHTQIFDLHLVLLPNPNWQRISQKTTKGICFTHTTVVSIEILRWYVGDKNAGFKLSTSIKCIEIIAWEERGGLPLS
jgi:hypothetical protein